jgi:hypothetical protein
MSFLPLIGLLLACWIVLIPAAVLILAHRRAVLAAGPSAQSLPSVPRPCEARRRRPISAAARRSGVDG